MSTFTRVLAMVRARLRPAAVAKSLRRSFAENLGFKVASILVALLLWGFVQGQRVVEASTRVEIVYRGLSEDLAFSTRPPTRARLTVTGRQSVAREVSRNNLTLLVDLSEAEVGVHTWEFRPEDVAALPDGLDVLRLVPNSVQLQVEKKLTRTLPLQAAELGRPAKGYKVVAIELEPEKVEVRGPASALDQVSALVTEGIPLEGLAESARLPVSLSLPARLELADGGQEIIAHVAIEAVTGEKTLGDVPVVVRHMGTGSWQSRTGTVAVTVEGPVSELEALDASALTVLVHVPEDTEPLPRLVGAGREGLRYELAGLPARVEVVDVEPDRIPVEPY